MKKIFRKKMPLIIILVCLCALLAACDARLGVGLNIGVPVGKYGRVSIGLGSWL